VRLLKLRDQQFIEVWVRTDDRDSGNWRREGHLVDCRTKFNVAAKECNEFGDIARAVMDERHAARLHATAGQFPT